MLGGQQLYLHHPQTQAFNVNHRYLCVNPSCVWGEIVSGLVPRLGEKRMPSKASCVRPHDSLFPISRLHHFVAPCACFHSLFDHVTKIAISLVPRRQIFCAHPAAFSKNRVWTLSLQKLGHAYIWRSVPPPPPLPPLSPSIPSLPASPFSLSPSSLFSWGPYPSSG